MMKSGALVKVRALCRLLPIEFHGFTSRINSKGYHSFVPSLFSNFRDGMGPFKFILFLIIRPLSLNVQRVITKEKLDEYFHETEKDLAAQNWHLVAGISKNRESYIVEDEAKMLTMPKRKYIKGLFSGWAD